MPDQFYCNLIGTVASLVEKWDFSSGLLHNEVLDIVPCAYLLEIVLINSIFRVMALMADNKHQSGLQCYQYWYVIATQSIQQIISQL